jgi:DNA-binding transcriptional ArsR family regulator
MRRRRLCETFGAKPTACDLILQCHAAVNQPGTSKANHFDICRNILRSMGHFDISRIMKHSDPTDLALTHAASTFAALGSEQRLTVLRTLVRAGEDGLTIGELGQRSGVTGSTLTHHLKILSQAGLVRQVRQGRQIICAAVTYSEIRALSDFLLSECCADSPHPAKDHRND